MTDLLERARPDRASRLTGMSFALVWLVTRFAMFMIFSTRTSYIVGDVDYYFQSLGNPTISTTLIEYPTPIVWFLAVVKQLTLSDPIAFRISFAVLMALTDATLSAVLWLRFSRRAALYWTMFLAFIGPLMWFRLDIIVGVLVALAVLYVVRRPVLSGVAVALGAAAKFWPALLILPLLGRTRLAALRTRGFVIAGAVVGLVSLTTAGLARSISPLTWQSDRGLQIESVAATVPMLTKVFRPAAGYQVFYSVYNAYEVQGPSTAAWARAADIALILAMAAIVGMGVIAALIRRVSPATMTTATIAVISLMIVTNKTFSPQYVIWLAGPLAALFTIHLSPHGRRLRAWLAGLGMAVAGLTQIVYPLQYGGIITPTGGNHITMVILVLRNLCMVALAAISFTWSLRSLLREYALSRTMTRVEEVPERG